MSRKILSYFYIFYIFLLIISNLSFIIFIGGAQMTITQKIKLAITYAGISEAELARRIGSSPAAFNQRMKTGKFSDDDLNKIVGALNATFEFKINFPDGTSI